ncbi:hypothetical protein [Methylobacterium pseudosasicola]|uniref:Uncharacterized protein n=1 Tax=Methylobacterium pseudosasicola TaxID=582667 RepID=A0A1I4II75_9HYPH|nr:hypothetical protein [Methylobacterium pseudosasicola]SFL53476.1 hypothetical protein SAMN05192568_1006135 [Methylobacterium pseudosasicola]
MRRPDQLALTDAATGRVSMPFLPTVAVVAVLGLASLYCPSSQPPSPEARAELTAPAAPSATAFARPMPVSSPIRRPASLAFAEIYPAGTPSVTPPARPALAGRTNAHIAVVGRHPCPGRRCPEVPQRGTDPLAAGRAEAAESEEAALLPPAALPFAASVVETLAPAARAVGDAAGLVRDGAAAVQGSVALVVADCLR